MLGNKVLAGGFLLGMVAFVLCGFGAGTIPSAGSSWPTVVSPHHHGVVAGVNPHLHLPSTPAAVKGKVAEARPMFVKTPWHRGWDARAYIALHRGLGTVRGVVKDGSGDPVADSRVALHKARGGVFRRVAYKHLTHTGANGEFAMTNVRPGTYRVYAYIDSEKKKGFSRLKVAAGKEEEVSVKIK